jgi:hypothetical protein
MRQLFRGVKRIPVRDGIMSGTCEPKALIACGLSRVAPLLYHFAL